jgi:hypothetical protein
MHMSGQTGYRQNGLEDGWLRPPGAAALPGGSSGALYPKRGISYDARYIVFWETLQRTSRLGLRTCFDTLDEARAYIETRPEYHSAGIWDRQRNAWAPE